MQALASLIERDGDPLVVKLPRTPERKDSEYMHLFSGDVDVEAHASKVAASRPARTTEGHSVAELAERISQLEKEVAAIKAKID